MNPRLVPIVVALGWSFLFLYGGTFIWFAYAALSGTGAGNVVTATGPLNDAANEAVTYVWTTMSVLVGGVVAVAFGQTPPRSGTENPAEKLVIYYAWAFVGVGLAAVAIWIFASMKGESANASILIKNAAVAFFGLGVPIITAFLRLPSLSGRLSGGFKALLGVHPMIDVCADFSIFPDNAPLPNSFPLSIFTFAQAGTGNPWFVNESGGERGLQFDAAGGRVDLATAVSEINFRVGTFSGPFELEGLNAAGSVIAHMTVAGTNRWTDQKLSAPGMVAVMFRGGGNEGALQKICVKICACVEQDNPNG